MRVIERKFRPWYVNVRRMGRLCYADLVVRDPDVGLRNGRRAFTMHSCIEARPTSPCSSQEATNDASLPVCGPGKDLFKMNRY